MINRLEQPGSKVLSELEGISLITLVANRACRISIASTFARVLNSQREVYCAFLPAALYR